MSTIDTEERQRLEKRLNSIAESILSSPSSTSRGKESLVAARNKAFNLSAQMDNTAYGVKRALQKNNSSDDTTSTEKMAANIANFMAAIRKPSEDTETPSLDWYNAQDIDSDYDTEYSSSRPDLSLSEAQQERVVATDQQRAAGEGLPSFIIAGSKFRSAIADTESDSYDTLFGNAERVEGKFKGYKLTAMPLSEVLDLVELNGDFHKRNLELGHDTTAVGKYQFVGNTLRDLRDRGILEELGINDDTVFDEETQDKIAVHLVNRRVKPSYSLKKAREEMGKEWEGFKLLSVERQNEVIKEIRGA